MADSLMDPQVEHEAECVRDALRKLPPLDKEASRAFEALGYLLETIRWQSEC